MTKSEFLTKHVNCKRVSGTVSTDTFWPSVAAIVALFDLCSTLLFGQEGLPGHPGAIQMEFVSSWA